MQRSMTSVSSPSAEVRIIASGLEFPEGPISLPDGSVLVTEIAAGTLATVSPDGSRLYVAETQVARVWYCRYSIVVAAVKNYYGRVRTI